MKITPLFLLLLVAVSCRNAAEGPVTLQGELQQWHNVTLVISGPETSEMAVESPFMDYRLEALFTKDSRTVRVPGYFAADGQAGESSATSGNTWKVHFRPDETGTWSYTISFQKGKNIAILDGHPEGEPVEPDGIEGSFLVEASDKTGKDFRANGRIVNGGKGYFKFQGTGEIWIKSGTNSPENFLAFADFDQTSRFSLKNEVREGEADPKSNLHRYEPHMADWKEGDPTWQEGMGKGIIGAVNYLASAGVNSIYMLTMNIIGDGKDVWPYIDYNERTRFDCSKLDQWGVVFDHMEQNGVMAHFVLQETENECLLDMGYTGVQRRVYLRELVARFGHHLGITWNMGEENGPADWSPIGMTEAQKKEMATYLKAIHPWPSIVVLHTHANDHHQDLYLTPLLGFEHLDGPSMQIGDPSRVHERILHFVKESDAAGKRWIVNQDEIGPHWNGVLPDSHDPGHDTVRHQCLWGTLLAGGGGVEWYFGYLYPHNDLTLEDFRSRENWWKQSAIATSFVSEYPLEEMRCMDELVNVEDAWCLASPGELYLVYLPAGWTNAALMTQGSGEMKVSWFDPRNGGDLRQGSLTEIEAGGMRDLGAPPDSPDMDWVVVVGR